MTSTIPTLIHIHEDDWDLRSLYPIAAQAETKQDLEMAMAASENNRAPSGVGWTDIYIIKKPSIRYAQLGLRVTDIAAALEPIMPRVRSFYATASAGFNLEKRDALGSYDDNAWCFGYGEHCYIKLEVKNDLVTDIWFDFTSAHQTDADAMIAAFRAINRHEPSLIVDYRLDMQGPIANDTFLNAYFQQLQRQR